MNFTKRQESELITAIKGRGEIPHKFLYLDEGAYEWAKVARQRSGGARGGINTLEQNLLAKRAKDFLETCSDVEKLNLVDLGPGDGEPIFPIIDELQKLKIPFRYVPVDISQEMLNIASRTLKGKVKGLEIKPVLLDFEHGSFPDIVYDLKRDGSSNLLLFLGSTIGNFSDMHRILSNFRDSMTSEDFLLTGVQLVNYSKINLILSHYKEKDVGGLCYTVPEKIGMRRGNLDWESSWNEKNHQVEVRVKLKEDTLVTVGKEKFTLDKGEEILLVRSVKFTESYFTELFQKSGFRNELLTTNSDQSYALSMVQPVRYIT